MNLDALQVSVTVLSPVPSGSEVFNTYGEYGNAELLQACIPPASNLES